MTNVFRRVLAAVCSLLVVSLAACGGGGVSVGGGTQTVTLYVSFSYTGTQSDVGGRVSVAPTISGLDGHTPMCAVTGGSLPPGVALDVSSCNLAGVTTTSGTYSATITLTSSGVQGSTSTIVNFQILDPTPTLVKAAGLNNSGFGPDLSVQYAQPLAPRQLVAVIPSSYTAKAGDSIGFSISGGTLPSGLTLDSGSGTLSGTPTGVGTFAPQIVATLTRAGVAYRTTPVTISIMVGAMTLQVIYPICTATVGTTYSCTPTAASTAAFAGVAVVFASPDLPSGFTIDAKSGTLTGIPRTVGITGVTVTATGTYPDGSVQTTTSFASVWSYTIVPTYAPSPNDIGVFSGPGPSSSGVGLAARITSGSLVSIEVTGYNSALAGDVHVFSLKQAGGVLPAWLQIDATTGRIYGVPPFGTVAPLNFVVVLATQRGGGNYILETPWLVTF